MSEKIMNNNTEENKKYFWFRLQTDFFESDNIKIIEAMPNGSDYIKIWLKLILRSITQEEVGLIRIKNMPITINIISTLIKEDVDKVNSALQIFGNLEMIKRTDDTLFIPLAKQLTGKHGASANRQKRIREKRKQEAKRQLLPSQSDVTSNSNFNSNSYRSEDSINIKKIYKNWLKDKENYYLNKFLSSLNNDEKNRIYSEAQKRIDDDDTGFPMTINEIIYMDHVEGDIYYKISEKYFCESVYPNMSKNEREKYLKNEYIL
ncbi:MAG: phage replisome organizer N-terminal domain-containing protein [Spirochaetes bacterium]|nr:phage replisome organizer N-terminal domain-containing protein [Spirochaetota bacterium]